LPIAVAARKLATEAPSFYKTFMKTDPLKLYVVSREALLKERATLAQRLSQIEAALGESKHRFASRVPARMSSVPLPRRRRNKLSLKAAVWRVTRARPLTKEEILTAVQRLGYKFTTRNPMNSLHYVLYSKGQFKRADGRFSPA
jgi:hypothetical protein